MFVLLQMVCTHIRLVVLAKSTYIYVCVFVEGMYTCKTWNFGKECLCLCFCCCKGYIVDLNFNKTYFTILMYEFNRKNYNMIL